MVVIEGLVLYICISLFFVDFHLGISVKYIVIEKAYVEVSASSHDFFLSPFLFLLF